MCVGSIMFQANCARVQIFYNLFSAIYLSRMAQDYFFFTKFHNLTIILILRYTSTHFDKL